jgi:hypothetical protein
VRYHYESEAQNPCSVIVIIGVGTTMRVENYDILSTEIARRQPGLIAAIVDHAPGNPLKLSTKRYTNLVEAVAARMEEMFPICQTHQRGESQSRPSSHRPKIFVGGHSASGMVAIKSLPLIKGFSPAGLVALSPFKITDDMAAISVPTLLWGFSTTTCGVDVGSAADQAYNLSSVEQGRVLYQLQNPEGEPSHCVFADDGCRPICPSSGSAEHAWIRPAVGNSIRNFLRAIEAKNFTKSSMGLDLPKNIIRSYLRMYVNQDQVPAPSSIRVGVDQE